MRFVNIVFFLILIALLTASTLLYLYDRNDSFAKWVDERPDIVVQIFDKGMELSDNYHVDPLWGVGAVVLVMASLFAFSFAGSKMPRPPSKALVFFIVFTAVIGLGSLVTIYYWPENTIRFGNFFSLRRGPRAQFREKLELVVILVVTLHIFFFLCFSLLRWIFWQDKRKKSKT